MINVNQITSQLARMPDQALQQFAQMHKSDPYSLALAVSESNRRKQIRSSQAMSVPQQPKVADAAISQMAQAPQQQLPENTGIGQLPPGDMNFSHGGIVAFNGRAGSDVSSYGGEFDTGSRLEESIEETVAREVANRRALEADRVRNMALVNAESSRGRTSMKDPRVLGAIPPIPGAVQVAKSGLGALAPAATAPAATAPAATAPAVVPDTDYMTQLAAARGPEYVQQQEAAHMQRLGMASDIRGVREKDLAELEKSQKERGDVFKGREDRIAAREGALEKSKETTSGLAFLEAGLAMMQSKGRGLSGIAEGAMVGTKSYASGIEKLKMAKDKLDDARDQMDELRRNQGDMDRREIRAAKNAVEQSNIEGQKLMLDGTEKTMGWNREDTKAAVAADMDARLKREQMASTADTANKDRAARAAVAKMPPAELQVLNALGKGDPVAGLKVKNALSTEGKTDLSMLKELMGDPTSFSMLPPEMQNMIKARVTAALQPKSAEGGGGPIRER